MNSIVIEKPRQQNKENNQSELLGLYHHTNIALDYYLKYFS